MNSVVDTTESTEKGPAENRRRPVVGIGLFVVTSLVGASMIFLVEPMVAKMLLPTYGGSPMVWNTSVLFFQAMMLAGYAYAHWSQRYGPRRQPLFHIVLIALPLLVLPVTLPAWTSAPDSWPTAPWLLLVLGAMVGAPFVALAATGPLTQRWYSWSGLPRSDDPYFLYAAGNVGSLLALLSYPFLVEPLSGLASQRRGWAIAYGVFVVLMAACAWMVVRSRRDAAVRGEADSAEEEGEERIGWRRRVKWTLLAALPSSLMLGATTHISTDIAPVPLMWVFPLTLYLLTFIIAFGVRRRPWLTSSVRACVIASALMPWVLLVFSSSIGLLLLPLDLLLVVVAGLACHGLLAEDRPKARHLTEFFLYVSLGGAVGGSFNGLLAPIVFNWVAEFSLAIAALAGLALLGGRFRRRDRERAPGRHILRSLVWIVSRTFLVTAPFLVLLLGMTSENGWLMLVSVLILLGWGALMLRQGPGVVIATAVLGVGLLTAMQTQARIHQERTFFGSYEVKKNDKGHTVFVHGTTIHGWQSTEPGERTTPTSYFSRSGPMGDVFAAYGGTPASQRVAIVGLGAGTVAAYGRSGQRMDFYEIDPAVVRIARSHFTYLKDCACEVRTRTGDGRLRIAEAPDASYGIIALDAFSSDAVPTHLLTREAIELYTRKLAPGGVLVFNVSNRNLELRPALAATARAAGMTTVAAYDKGSEAVALSSVWAVVARSEADLAPLRARGARWQPVRGNGTVWTDSYSSIVGVLAPLVKLD